MSGLEIIVIVGAGYLITKKVQEHRKNKALKAAGIAPEGHGTAVVVTPGQQQNKQKPVEEDQLPLYSPPTKEFTENGGLPSYDDLAKQRPEGSNPQQYGTAMTGQNSTRPPTSEVGNSSKRWRKLLNRTPKQESRQSVVA